MYILNYSPTYLSFFASKKLLYVCVGGGVARQLTLRKISNKVLKYSQLRHLGTFTQRYITQINRFILPREDQTFTDDYL